jgi:hypothetical protein
MVLAWLQPDSGFLLVDGPLAASVKKKLVRDPEGESTMSLKPEQSYDLNGDRSNSYTRDEAREALVKRTDLTAEERKWWENRTQCLRGDAYQRNQQHPSSDLAQPEKATKEASKGRREYDFSQQAKSQAFARQEGRCACCGESLQDQLDNAHHVVPNQVGRRGREEDSFLRSSDNCVYLCESCHERVHQDGRYREGAVAGPEYYRHSHGGNQKSHQQWARLVNAYWDRRFPKASAAEQPAPSAMKEYQAVNGSKRTIKRPPQKTESRKATTGQKVEPSKAKKLQSEKRGKKPGIQPS